MSDNDAEELLPVTAFEKVIKTTIGQAASPVTRQDMWEAYKAAIPGATVTVSPEGAMPWEGRGTRVISSPEACRDVCLSVLEQVPDNAERTRLQNIMVSELERVGEETESSTAYCAHCGKPFTPANRRQRYCRQAHRVAAYEARKRELQPTGA